MKYPNFEGLKLPLMEIKRKIDQAIGIVLIGTVVSLLVACGAKAVKPISVPAPTTKPEPAPMQIPDLTCQAVIYDEDIKEVSFVGMTADGETTAVIASVEENGGVLNLDAVESTSVFKYNETYLSVKLARNGVSDNVVTDTITREQVNGEERILAQEHAAELNEAVYRACSGMIVDALRGLLEESPEPVWNLEQYTT